MNWKSKFLDTILTSIFILIISAGAWIIFYKIDSQNIVLTQLRVFIQYVAVILGGIGVIIALLNYKRKSGVHISCFYNLATIRVSDKSVRIVKNIWLINNKDKAETIFTIFLKNKNGKLFLSDMTNSPLILPPYSSVKINVFGSSSDQAFFFFKNKRYYLNHLLENGDHDLFSNEKLISSITDIVESKKQKKCLYIQTFTGTHPVKYKAPGLIGTKEHNIHFYKNEPDKNKSH